MIVSDWAVRNRTTVFFMVVIIVISGLMCYFSLPRESSPDIPIPTVFISTSYRGASPEDIEKLITIPIEDKLKGLSGVKEIKSVSEDSQSIISVEFETGINIDDVLPKVKDKVDLSKVDLPSDLEDDPVIEEMNFSEFPILIIGLSGDFGQKQLGKLADDLQDDIEGVPGVLEAELSGKVDREIQVQLFPMRMTQYNIPMSTITDLVGQENRNVSGGSIKLKQGRFQLRVPGEFKTPEEANDLVVASGPEGSVYLRDIGEVRDGFKDRDTASRVNGEASITVSVKKRAGANTVEIVDRIDELLKERKKHWPKGLKVTRLMDNAKEVRTMVDDLEDNMISGLLLVILVVCVAMGLRNSIIVSLSIPLSMLISFCVLKVLGITLNMVVLFSLTLALGMLVDNAIVIVENIYRFMQQGVGRIEAAMRATSEVAFPIIGSALTTIAAFVPLLWWKGIMGEFMSYIPKTVIITLVSCLFVAMVINPAIAAALMKIKRKKGKRVSADDIVEQGEHPMLEGGGRILDGYRWLLNRALNNRITTLIVAFLFLILMIQFWTFRIGLEKPMEFFPSPDPKDLYVNFNMPQGCGLNYADDLIKKVATRLYDKNAVSEQAGSGAIFSDEAYRKSLTPKEHTYRSSGEKYYSPSWLPNIEYSFEKSSFRPGMQFFGQGSENQIGLHCVDLSDRTEPSTVTKDRIAQLVKDIPGAEINVEEEQSGPPTGKPINIEISGEDFKTLGELSKEVVAYVKRVPFVRNVRSDYESGSPTLQIKVDRKKAGYLGLSTATVGYLIKAAFNGVKVSNYREGDEKYDMLVRFDDVNRGLIDSLRQIMIVTEQYGRIPLTTIANIEYTGGLGRITRIDNKRVVTVSADIDQTKTTGAVALQQAMSLLAGSSRITERQISDWAGFIKKLKSAIDGKESPVLGRIASDLSGSARDIISSYKSGAQLGSADKNEIIKSINELLERADFYDAEVFESKDVPEQAAGIIASGQGYLQYLQKKDLVTFNRALVEAAFGGLVGKSDNKAFVVPTGYNYVFTGENEEQSKATSFLGFAFAVAAMLILFVLVAQFNSVAYPFVIMSAVILSLGGVFLGLGVAGMPFSLIMTGVGVISLAGVVVNNAIVLVDYTLQLRKRNLSFRDSIIAAGATRLRPVVLTAFTTILGLIPMAMGWSYDFKSFEFQWESESSQWWGPMAIPVIFGLLVATVLTLVVVPALISLVEDIRDHLSNIKRDLMRVQIFVGYRWIGLYDRIYRTDHAHGWKQRKLREYADNFRDQGEPL